jgi:uncharacterized protein (DUF2236 family)
MPAAARHGIVPANSPAPGRLASSPAPGGAAGSPAPGGLASAPVGPGSLTWRHFGDRRLLLFLGRTGMLQNMHPAVGAALQQHSNFFQDPWDRLFRSIPPILGVIYDPPGSPTATMVRDFHKDIKGLDTRGRRYHALSPEVFWWTHVTFVEGILAVNDFFGTPLTRAESDQLFAESVTWWRRYGLSDRPVFSSYAEFGEYWQRMLGEELERNTTTDHAIGLVGTPVPPPPAIPRAIWPLIRGPFMRFNLWLGTGLLPPRARDILGLPWTARDQRRLRIFAAVVRRTWPLLPRRVRYERRAYLNMKRVSAGTWAPAAVSLANPRCRG